MTIRRRHAIPSTLMESGRVVRVAPLELAGPADALVGVARYREVYRRLRRSHDRRAALGLMFGVWRFGVVLQGAPSSRFPDPAEDGT